MILRKVPICFVVSVDYLLYTTSAFCSTGLQLPLDPPSDRYKSLRVYLEAACVYGCSHLNSISFFVATYSLQECTHTPAYYCPALHTTASNPLDNMQLPLTSLDYVQWPPVPQDYIQWPPTVLHCVKCLSLP